MASIWIILLDTSGSMGRGFTERSGGSADPLEESGAWATKLDAAKDILLRQISSIREQDIAVLRFTDTYEKIFQGPKDELLAKPDLIRSLDASGGTSIATALDGVREDPGFENYRSLSLVVLTDGLSDLEAASQAAQALIVKYPFARIDTILIDESVEGKEVADSISLHGRVSVPPSPIRLATAVSLARTEGLQSELSNIAIQRFQVQQELALLQVLAVPTLLRVTSGHLLTGATLRNDLAPTIDGIESIGRAVSYASRTEYRGSVSSISQDSPISINLTGLKDTVELVLAYVIPWRRRNAERLSALEVRKRELEVERQERDLSFHSLEVEERRLETAKIELDLAKSKWELAEKMLKELDPDSQLRGEARENAILRLLSGIEQFSSTRLEFKVVREIQPQSPLT